MKNAWWTTHPGDGHGGWSTSTEFILQSLWREHSPLNPPQVERGGGVCDMDLDWGVSSCDWELEEERWTIWSGVCTWDSARSSKQMMLRLGFVSPFDKWSPPWPLTWGRVSLDGSFGQSMSRTRIVAPNNPCWRGLNQMRVIQVPMRNIWEWVWNN